MGPHQGMSTSHTPPGPKLTAHQGCWSGDRRRPKQLSKMKLKSFVITRKKKKNSNYQTPMPVLLISFRSLLGFIPWVWRWVGFIFQRRASATWAMAAVHCVAHSGGRRKEEEEELIHSPRAVYAFSSFLRLKEPVVTLPRHLQLHRSCMLSFSHSTIPGNCCFP